MDNGNLIEIAQNLCMDIANNSACRELDCRNCILDRPEPEVIEKWLNKLEESLKLENSAD